MINIINISKVNHTI